MEFTLTNGIVYAMLIYLTGSGTWLTDDVVAQKLMDMGWIEVEITQQNSNTRYAVAKWNGETGADPAYFPPEISDLHEL